MQTTTIRDRAPQHTHSRAQNKALKCCVICMNVTAHDAQCKTEGDSCLVGSCSKNWK